MYQAVDHGHSHLFIVEDMHSLDKFQVYGYEHALLPVAIRMIWNKSFEPSLSNGNNQKLAGLLPAGLTAGAIPLFAAHR